MEAVDAATDPTTAVVSLAGELDAADPSWADELRAVLEDGCQRLVIDLLNVTFVDSSVVHELLLAYQRVGPDGWVRLVYTHHLIGRVVEICGLNDAFPHFTTVEAALRNAPSKLGIAARHSAGQDGIRP